MWVPVASARVFPTAENAMRATHAKASARTNHAIKARGGVRLAHGVLGAGRPRVRLDQKAARLRTRSCRPIAGVVLWVFILMMATRITGAASTCTPEEGSLCCGLSQGAYGAAASLATCTTPACNPITGGVGYLPAAAAAGFDAFTGDPNATTIGVHGTKAVTIGPQSGNSIASLPTLIAYLAATGTPGKFNGTVRSDTHYSSANSIPDPSGGGSKGQGSGVLAGQTMTTSLNIFLSGVAGGFTPDGFGGFRLPTGAARLCTKRSGPSKVLGSADDVCEAFSYPSCVSGATVSSVLAASNQHLTTGQNSLGCTASNLASALTNINQQFDQCGNVIACPAEVTATGPFPCPRDDPDADRDGFTPQQGDCDDTNSAIHPGVAERCNGIDDNCDGMADNGFDVGVPCSVGVGACARSGLKACTASGDATFCPVTPGNPSPETCNGIDDDCDGPIDEDLGSTTCGTAPCQQTVENCIGGVPQTCTPGAGGPETCNGIDDDCDGSVDEDLGSTTCGTDACQQTVQNCIGGVPQICTPGTGGPETCNGLDDDCDGSVDEDLGSTTCGTDACQRTVENCVGGVPQTCTPGTGSPETCNGIDDDCDGQVDDGVCGFADLRIEFTSVPTNPPVGGGLSPQSLGVDVINDGPSVATGVTARFQVPAGYTLTNVPPPSQGTYDSTTGDWTIGSMGSPAHLFLQATVNATGPYDLTATITGSSQPDPNPANNTATASVTPNANADLRISCSSSRPTPAVGQRVVLTVGVNNDGPAIAIAAARFQVPAGYTVVLVTPSQGTYDLATGDWTIGSLGNASLSVAVNVNATGPYDLTATITGSSQPDPNLANNTATATVTPNPDADVRISFGGPPTGTLTVGSSVGWSVLVENGGPSLTTGVTVRYQVPAGYTVIGGVGPSHGTYDPATGIWTIGSVGSFTTPPGLGSPPRRAELALSSTVNATGPMGLTATITGSSQPDPDLTNNIVTAAPANRPPVADAGAHQEIGTRSTVLLDGSLSSDADSDSLSFLWAFFSRPPNSTAVLSGANTATPSFIADAPGTYTVRLTVADTSGAADAPATVTISAVVLNSPPVITSAPLTIGEVGQPYSYDVDAGDPDAGDLLTFSLTTAPAGMAIDPATGVIDWTPAADQGGQGAVIVRVQDQGGLPATQGFAVQVSSPANHAPVATDDAYEVRLNESLSVPAPSVLANDNDSDGNPLAATLLTSPTNGTVGFNHDGSFTYTPSTLQDGEFVTIENLNLATRVPGATVAGGGFEIHPELAFDDDLNTDAITFQATPFLEVAFPQGVTVNQLQLFGPRASSDIAFGYVVLAGSFQLFDAAGSVLFDSGVVDLPAPNHDATLTIPDVTGVRRVRFTNAPQLVASQSHIAELKVIGSALVRRQAVVPDQNLAQLLPVTVHASSSLGFNIPENIVDDYDSSPNWYSSGQPGEFIEILFPLDVTVTELQTVAPFATPDGMFQTGNDFFCTGTLQLLDLSDNVLFDSGVVRTPHIAVGRTFTLPVPSVAGVRRIRYTVSSCDGSRYPAGFSEVRVFGSASLTTPAFRLARKFQGLVRRPVHSTPVVANLTDDNGDGRIDQHDIPDIVVPVETVGIQLTGEIKVISGDDGRELLTLGGPDLVSPWSEVAVGDIDGDGLPEIVAVHSDGNHLIAFDHTGQIKWISDPNPMPRQDNGIVGGAVAIANLDNGPRPHITVGASVFSSEGTLLGDGRALGGTTAGTGLRSAMSAVADLDLDFIPEIIAGPTAYRLVGGQLTTVWQRTDRPDGYVAIGNFDDDPFPEIVVVADGQIYMLNHDGTDADVWNPPTHAPMPTPGGSLGGAPPASGQAGPPLIVDVNADGIPEIGIATASNYILFNRDGTVRWRSGISDHSSHSTGSVAFDFDGDGNVEIVYRDEISLRIFRGNDGVLLAKIPLSSNTWGEEPVVVDVDNDGHADIVVSSNGIFGFSSPTNTGVHVFSDVANKWTRTRRIWNQHSYHITNVNEDATIPQIETPNWLVPGLNNFRMNAFIPGESTDQADSFTYKASDANLDSNEATVRITIRTPNGSPRIVSTPPTTAAVGLRYVYAVRASDPDPGDVFTFSLPTAPAGMAIDRNFGLIQWTPASDQLGIHDVVVKVQDVHGVFALQGYTVQVLNPATVPNVVGQPQATAQANLAAASFTAGAITTQNSPTALPGSVMSQNPVGGTLAAPGSPVSLVVSIGPAPAGTVPSVVGQVQPSAEADITASGFTVGTVSGQYSATVPFGIVLSQDPLAGTIATAGSPVNLVLSLGPPPDDVDQDGDGFSPNQGDCDDADPNLNPDAVDAPGDGFDQNCNGVDSIAGDTTPPTVGFSTPADDAIITMPTDIIGTADDAHFLAYTLEVASVDDDNFTIIGSGTTPVINGTLGRLDPTLLENGMYRVLLTAEDVNGQMSVDERVYRVAGEAKVGLFALSFVDLQVPVSGIPITVIRSYDSRVKTRRDFGIGWSLAIKNGKYQNNRLPGLGWIINDLPFLGGFLPCIGGTSETRSHFTEVRLSGREVYTFALSVSNGNLGITGACEGTAGFRFIDGTLPGATLEILDGTDVIYVRGGTDEVLDMNAFLDGRNVAYNPQRVRLTTIDDRKIDFDRLTGITRIEDSNGNALSITDAGVVHSSGNSIAFRRDGAGRIIRITDPLGNTLSYGYDGDGNLTSAIDQAANETTFTYDTRHNLTEIRDPLGNRAVRSEYDAEGRLVAVIDAKGGRIEFAHNVTGREEVVTDARGNVTRVVYDDLGNVQSQERAVTVDGVAALAVATFVHDGFGNELVVVDPDGRRTESVYDHERLLTQVEDPVGLALQSNYTYDSRGVPLTLTNPAGETTTLAYDSRGSLIRLSDPLENLTQLENDAQGHPTRVVDAAGTVTLATYDGSGRLLREQRQAPLGSLLSRRDHTYDANGNQLTKTVFRTVDGVLLGITTTSTYDVLNRVTAVTDPAGYVSRTEYNALGRVAARVDALGRRTELTYDEVGALVRTDFPDGTFETLGYDASGNRISRTEQSGRITTFEYDELNREIRRVLPDGTSYRTVYSPGGRTQAVIDGLGNRTDFAFDSVGRQIRATLPEVFDATSGTSRRPETLQAWDAAGRPVAVVDPNGQRTEHVYDGAGRRTRTTYADGTTREQSYDALGRVIEKRDEGGRVTAFEYDGLGRLIAVTDPAGGRTVYRHDETGNLVDETDALGRTTGYRYDPLNRLIEKTLPGGGRESFTYDAVGNLVSHTDFNGDTTTFQYDAMNRLVRRSFPGGSAVTATYTPTGRRNTLTDARGATVYQYDADDRLAHITHPGGEVVTYTYDGNGGLQQLSSPSGAVSYEYDALNRLRRVSTPTGAFQYDYDLAGNPLQITAPNGVVSQSSYDARNLLTQIQHTLGGSTIGSFANSFSPTGRRLLMTEADSSVETYAYDSLDRLQSEARTGTNPRSISYEYDAVGNRTRMVRDGVATDFSYDVDDRLLSAGGTTYTYDHNGNLVSQTSATAATTYDWDFENRLLSATGPSGVTQFAYDADGHRVERRAVDGVTQFLVDAHNLTRLPQVLEERDGVGGLRARYTYGTDLLAMTQGAATSFYQYDGLGSTRILTDATGRVTDTYNYEAYGNLAASTGSTANPYRFAGEQFEPSVGFYNLRARNYDTTVGRFLGRDPEPGSLGDPRSRHPFAYTHGDPVNLIDPTGRFTLIEVSVSLDVASVQASFDSKLVKNFFFPVGKIALCQLKPAFQLREVGLLMIADDLPGGELVFDEGVSLIQTGARAIHLAGIAFVKSLEVKALKVELGGRYSRVISTLGTLTGADPNSLVNLADLGPDERVRKLIEFEAKLETWLEEYATALESVQSGDDCTKFEGAIFFGEKVLDFLPGF